MNASAVALSDLNHALEHATADQRRALSDNERALLRVALQAFAELGYTATSARQVALDAGLTAPMVNYYFGSKKGLYEAVGRLIFGALVKETGEALDGVQGFSAQVRAVIDSHVAFAERSPVSVEFICMALYGPMDGRRVLDPYGLHAPAAARSRTIVADAVRSGELVLEDGLDQDYVVSHLWGIVRNAWLSRVRALRRARLATEHRSATDHGRADVDRDVALFLRGIGVR
jgi:AcrR family transcriptional regulator